MENKATEIRPHTTPACLCGIRFHVLLAEWEKRGGRVRAWREKELPFCSLSHVPGVLLPANLFQKQGQRSNILKYGFKSETSGER